MQDWDDEMDGEWEPPMIDNPDYKGEWKPRQIDNPDYKGMYIILFSIFINFTKKKFREIDFTKKNDKYQSPR